MSGGKDGESGGLNLSAFLPYRLSIASNAVSDLIAREYQSRFGLRIPEWRVMAVLGQCEGCTQSALVAATRMDKVTVNRAVKVLADRQLIDRQPHRRDGRSHDLALSTAGRALYREIAPAAMDMEQRLCAVFSDGEKRELESLLDRLRVQADLIAGGK